MKKLLTLLVCVLLLTMSVMVTIIMKQEVKCDGFNVWKYTYDDGTVSYSGSFARFLPWWWSIGKCK